MKIERIELSHIRVPLNEPFRISSGAVAEKDAIVVRVWADGVLGYGESSPMAGAFYSDETPETCRKALTEQIIPRVLGEDIADIPDFNRRMRAIPGNHFAKTGVETALWDIEAKRQKMPLYRLLGGTWVRVDSGLAVGLYDTIEETLDRIERYLGDGYRRVKIKIKPGWDVEPVGAVRKTFGDINLFVDANSAYTLKDLGVFKRLDDFGLMMVEQPFRDVDLEGLAALQRQIQTPVCLDESIHDVETARRAIEMGACRIINIKIQRMGGLWHAKALHDLCQEQGIPVWVGTMPELGIGGVQGIALASLEGCTYPTDVEPSRRFFMDDIVQPLIEMDPDGTLAVPEGAGLGYVVDERKIRRYEIWRETFT